MASGVGEGAVGVTVGMGSGVLVSVGARVGVGVASEVSVGEAVGVTVGLGASVSVVVGVTVGSSVPVGVIDGEGDGVADLAGAVGVRVKVGATATVGLAVGWRGVAGASCSAKKPRQ